MITSRSLLIFCILIASSFSYLYGQIKLEGSLESGYYKSAGTNDILQNGFFTGIDGKAGYNYRDKQRIASINLRARPEFYGFDNQLRTLKLKGEASYIQNEESFNWGIKLAQQKYNFISSGLDLTYNMFDLSGSLDGYVWEGSPAALNFGFAYQDIGTPNEQSLDLFFGEGKLYQSLNEFTKFGYGAYLERFIVTGNPPYFYSDPKSENKGWRYGPEFSLNYLGAGVFNLDYRFLFHNSGFTHYPSIEHWIRLVAGKIISEHLSVFLLIDYYLRNFKYNDNAEKYSYLLYTAMNFDNRIYVKLGYDINDNVEVYLRSGYFKENLYGNKLNFDGWNALIGIDVSN